ncbi:MAG TPA: hypothetical protein VLV78_03325 [Thermoanaerobaculia bacterium]|nr:hypothetical protein [Thermoanaerobaculia bacterium]
MADEDFILDTDENKPVVAPRELTGWEDVIFELADDDGESA